MNKNIVSVGDTVYAIKNSAWGNKPMKVTMLYESGSGAQCKHPTLGYGGFEFEDISSLRLSKTREGKLKKLATLEKQVKKLKKELFG